MTVSIEYEAERKLSLPYEEIIEEIVLESLDYEKCPYEAEVNVILTDNEAIREINREHRGIDAPTDVLSFPMVDYERPSDFDHVENAAEDYFNPETGELMLGDIVISVDKVTEQAEKYGHSERRELAFLVAHSMLHLCGYDHMEDGERLVTTPPYTAYLKIAEGCSNGCAFCIIPKLRGRYRSRTMDSLLREARELEARGTKELIVIAQDITRYGLDLKDGSSLAGLLKELCKLDFHWIRLHYLYPEVITDELIDVIAHEKKIVHYLDIPIQHCNDRILKAMRRHNTRQELEELFAKLRSAIPDVVLRTSLICGLPGETDEEFEELCEFLREQKLQRAGVFQFSPEEGTLAERMEDQVDPETAARRVELVVDLQSRIMDEYNEERLGTVMEVLCEGFDSQAGCFVGRTYADSVEIDGHVYFTAAGVVPAGAFVNVRITGVSDGDLTGEVED